MRKIATLALTCAAFTSSGNAYNMNSVATPVLSFTGHSYLLDKVSDPVHEMITMVAYDCQANPGACRGEAVSFDRAKVTKTLGSLVEGVEWNDDPSILLAGNLVHKKDWIVWMNDGQKIASCDRNGGTNCKVIDQSYDLLYRSHFGDLQFLHAMASRDGEPAAETRQKVIDWAEYTYKVAIGIIQPDVPLSAIKDVAINKYIQRGSWTTQYLFTHTTNDQDAADRVYLIALGSLLHMIQDSFSDSHVRRAGSCNALNHNKLAIQEFHNYAAQDPNAHKRADVKPQWLEVGDISDSNPVTASAKILRAAFNSEPWDTVVRPLLLNDILKISDQPRVASGGDPACFRR